jgi:hypothetical protein
VLSPKDRVGDTPYVLPREPGSEEGGDMADDNILAPEDRVGNVEYTSADYHTGRADPDKTYGDNGVAYGDNSVAPSAQAPASSQKSRQIGLFCPSSRSLLTRVWSAQARGDAGSSRRVPVNSDASELPMGTNFVASKQGEEHITNTLGTH